MFGCWDPFPDDAYVAAQRAGVLDAGRHLETIAEALREVRPMKAAFDARYVKRLDGPNVKPDMRKRAALESLREDINTFKERHRLERVVMIWCGSTEIFLEPSAAHMDIESFERAIDNDDLTIAPSMLYAYAALQEGVPFINGAPNLTVDIPVLERYAVEHKLPISGKDFKTGQTLIKSVLAPMFKARMLGVAGWYSTNILGNRDGEVLDDPDSFKTKEESKLGVLEHILEPERYPQLYGDVYHKVRINYYPPRGDNKEGWDNIDIFGWLGYPMQLKVDFLCRDSILAAPLALDLVLFTDLAQPRRPRRHPGVAELLLQGAAGARRAVSRARPVHPADQAQEHAALDDGRGPDHPPRHRLLHRRVVSRGGCMAQPDVGEAEAALDAEVAVGDRVVLGARHLDDAVVLHVQLEVAADAAVPAHRRRDRLRVLVPGAVVAHLELGRRRERARWAHRDAVAAVDAGGVGEHGVPLGGDVGVEAATGDGDGERVLPLLAARVDALVTEDAAAVVAHVELVVDRRGLMHGRGVVAESCGAAPYSSIQDATCGAQSSSTVDASSSSTSLRAWCVRSVWVCTTMPSSAWREHAGASTRLPSSSTTQMRHAFFG